MGTHNKPARYLYLALAACCGIGLALMTPGTYAANAITLQSFDGGSNAIAGSGASLVKTGASVFVLSVSAVPVPAALCLFGAGLLGLAPMRRRAQT